MIHTLGGSGIMCLHYLLCKSELLCCCPWNAPSLACGTHQCDFKIHGQPLLWNRTIFVQCTLHSAPCVTHDASTYPLCILHQMFYRSGCATTTLRLMRGSTSVHVLQHASCDAKIRHIMAMAMSGRILFTLKNHNGKHKNYQHAIE